MKTFTLLLTATFFIIYTSAAIAQPEQKPFKGTYVNDEHQFSLTLNLYENDLEAPGFSFLGKMGGYLHGRGIYGTWFLTEHHIKGKKATLRMSNDSVAPHFVHAQFLHSALEFFLESPPHSLL